MMSMSRSRTRGCGEYPSSYVTDEDGNRTHVIIPNDEFEMLLDDLEDLWDLRRYDALKGNAREDRDAVPAEEFFDQLDRERGWNTR